MLLSTASWEFSSILCSLVRTTGGSLSGCSSNKPAPSCLVVCAFCHKSPLCLRWGSWQNWKHEVKAPGSGREGGETGNMQRSPVHCSRSRLECSRAGACPEHWCQGSLTAQLLGAVTLGSMMLDCVPGGLERMSALSCSWSLLSLTRGRCPEGLRIHTEQSVNLWNAEHERIQLKHIRKPVAFEAK